MNKDILIFLSVLYFVAAIIYIFREGIYIKKHRSIGLLSLTRLMYSFSNGFLPAILYYREVAGMDSFGCIDLSTKGIVALYAIYILSIIVYTSFEFGTRLVIKKRNGSREKIYEKYLFVNRENCIRNNRTLLICAYIMLIGGWLSLYLWTKAYGSMWAFIQNAAAIRSGYGAIKNNLGFFKEFSRVINYAFYAFFLLFLHEKRLQRKIWLAGLTIIAFGGCLVYTMASDSRISVGLVIICAALLYMDYSVSEKGQKISKQMWRLAVIAVIGYICIVMSEYVMNSLRRNTTVSVDFDIFSSISKEFRFVTESQQNALLLWWEGKMDYKLLDDMKRAVFAWIPTRFYPANMPSSVWMYNTGFLSYSSGTMPTDILACGIYHLGILGVIITPMVYGVFLNGVQNKLTKPELGFLGKTVYYGVCASFIQSVTHFQLHSIVLKLFPVFLFILTCFFINMFQNSASGK